MRLARAVELVPVSVKCPLPEQFPEYACCHGDTCEKLPLLVGGEILERETEEYQRHLVLGEKFCAPFNDALPLIAGDVLTDQRQDVLFFVLEMGIDSGRQLLGGGAQLRCQCGVSRLAPWCSNCLYWFDQFGDSGVVVFHLLDLEARGRNAGLQRWPQWLVFRRVVMVKRSHHVAEV